MSERWLNPRLELADRLEDLADTIEKHAPGLRWITSSGRSENLCSFGKDTLRSVVRSLREAAELIERDSREFTWNPPPRQYVHPFFGDQPAFSVLTNCKEETCSS